MAEMLPIVDAHVHLWNPEQFSMPWLASIPLLNRPYGLQDYRQETQGLPIIGLVYVEVGVEPQEVLLEARYVAALAQQEPRLQAIVAAAPVELGIAVRKHVESLLAISPLIKGVRRNLQDETQPDFCLQPDFVAGVRLLAEYNLSFDLCIRHWQLPAVTELVRRCPDTQFILDHLGKPNVKEHLLDPWRDQLRVLAGLPNVVCKISGLVTEADHTAWKADDLTPYLSHALEVFGEDRIAFGGDWPVILQASPYVRWIETLQAFTASLSLEAQRKFWSENTCRFYRFQAR
jgi:L-fuconolactonase